jgi:hypothetical protein
MVVEIRSFLETDLSFENMIVSNLKPWDSRIPIWMTWAHSTIGFSVKYQFTNQVYSYAESLTVYCLTTTARIPNICHLVFTENCHQPKPQECCSVPLSATLADRSKLKGEAWQFAEISWQSCRSWQMICIWVGKNAGSTDATHPPPPLPHSRLFRFAVE